MVIISVGSVEVVRHENFRIFAAMNPPTDVGKKELPPSIRGKFTEIYTEEVVNNEDLKCIIKPVAVPELSELALSKIVYLYLECRRISVVLTDGAGLRPHYSLRSLTRTMKTISAFRAINIPLEQAVYEAFLLNFQKMLNSTSRQPFADVLSKSGLFSDQDIMSSDKLPRYPKNRKVDWVEIRPFWLQSGTKARVDWSIADNGVTRFVMNEKTPTVKAYVRDIAAGIAANVAPVLLQGPTSVGKTTMIEYIAARTGHTCIRINNHEHTDVQEYIGSFVTTSTGQLEFKDGLLVEAIRNGYWIILDELNLAPTDVLEALNRLLDDNKELLIPETGEVVKPSAGFFLFATQNPPGIYGGRKPLSRAFRNRFLEICVNDLPFPEVQEIIARSCGITEKISSFLVQTMKCLHEKRQLSTLFSGKYGAITVRDLIKWGNRKPCTALQAAERGYLLLTEKLRSVDEKKIVEDILNSVCKVVLDVGNIYSHYNLSKLLEAQAAVRSSELKMVGVKNIAITNTIRRLWILLEDRLEHKEPVLIIGETGCGKTTVCQLMASVHNCSIKILNCHQSTETADIIGGLRPVRGHRKIQDSLVKLIALIWKSLILQLSKSVSDICMQLVNGLIPTEKQLKMVIEEICSCGQQFVGQKRSRSDEISTVNIEMSEISDNIPVHVSEMVQELAVLWQRYVSLFEWVDGPLVTAMKNGDYFLMDEINLADDAVIERLNSVLESGRSITLTEKGGIVSETIVAHPNFRFLATMNPGGDYGKRELSPALTSRFSELWVPSVVDEDEMLVLVLEVLQLDENCEVTGSLVAQMIVKFSAYLKDKASVLSAGFVFSIREILAWAQFIVKRSSFSKESVFSAYLHGARMLILDGLGMGSTVSKSLIVDLRHQLQEFLVIQCANQDIVSKNLGCFFDSSSEIPVHVVPVIRDNNFVVDSFSIPMGNSDVLSDNNYCNSSKITILNMGRVLRAMQLSQPVLLEGPPGVGKSSLIANLASLSGHKLVRINLSEHSELSDLLGSDLPSKSSTENSPLFEWHDGAFLQAMKAGDWVLLDELNLAPQSVLEGLNACFDHREEVYIPEVDITVHRSPHFKVFCSQNPMVEGGGRKGLPQSFLNRFSRVYVEAMSREDLLEIIHSTHFKSSIVVYLDSMVDFVLSLQNEISNSTNFGVLGGPWEFNLRDIFRWCEVISSCLESYRHNGSSQFTEYCIANSAYYLFLCRLRCSEDRSRVMNIFLDSFKFPLEVDINPKVFAGNGFHTIGSSTLFNGNASHTDKYPYTMTKSQEGIVYCINLHLPVLLVGTTGSSSLNLVKELATLSGNFVDYYSATPATDSSDLLGAFEQIGGGFEWVNGAVVSAVISGHWFVMDNVNLCPSSVLDRLNGLLEPNGELLLTENGSSERIIPHPNFRVFFLMNPSTGEISRAMRNRCVEIFIGESEVYGDEYFDHLQDAWRTTSRLSQLKNSLGDVCCGFFSSLMSSKGIPKLEYFRRFCQVVEINLENEHSLPESLESALGFVLPGYVYQFQMSSKMSKRFEFDSNITMDLWCWLFLLAEQFQSTRSPWLLILLRHSILISGLPHSLFHASSMKFGTLNFSCNNPFDCAVILLNISLLTMQDFSHKTLVEAILSGFEGGTEMIEMYTVFCNRLTFPANLPVEIGVRFTGDSLFNLALPSAIGIDMTTYQKVQTWILLKLNTSIRSEDLVMHAQRHVDDSIEWNVFQSAETLIIKLDEFINYFGVSVLDVRVLPPVAVIHSLMELMWRRNILSNALAGHGEQPWNELFIAVRWVKKVTMEFETIVDSTTLALFQKILDQVEEFFSKISNYFNTTFCSQKIRLLKVGGRSSIPVTIDEWDLIIEMRKVLFDNLALRFNADLRKDWLMLYSTFYCYHTSEKFMNSSMDFRVMISAIQGKASGLNDCGEVHESVAGIANNYIISVLSNVGNELSSLISGKQWIPALNHLPVVLKSTLNLIFAHSASNLIYYRELQTLIWRVENVIVSDGHDPEAFNSMIAWIRIFFVALDRILWLLQLESKNNFDSSKRSDTTVCLKLVDVSLLHGSMLDSSKNRITFGQSVTAGSVFSEVFRMSVIGGSRSLIDNGISRQSLIERRNCLTWHDYRVDLMCNYTCDIVWSCRDFFRTDFVSLREICLNWKSCRFDQFRKLSEILSNCVISCGTGAVLTAFLHPLLSILSTTEIYDCNNVNALAVGKAWILVGLLRCHLLSLSLMIDPAVKPILKSKLLSDSLLLKESSLKMSIMHNSLSSRTLLNSAVIESYELIDGIKDKISSLKSKGIERHPSSSPFFEFSGEFKNFLKEYLSTEVTSNLLDSLCEVNDKNTWDALRVRIANFQFALETFHSKLQVSYWTYEDIISVIVSAFSNISLGLDIVVSALETPFQDSRFPWEHYIQYPILADIRCCTPESTTMKLLCDKVSHDDHVLVVNHFLLKLDYVLSLGIVNIPLAFSKFEECFKYFTELHEKFELSKKVNELAYCNYAEKCSIADEDFLPVDDSVDMLESIPPIPSGLVMNDFTAMKLVTNHFRLAFLHCASYFKSAGQIWIRLSSDPNDFERTVKNRLIIAHQLNISGVHIGSVLGTGEPSSISGFDSQYRSSALHMMAVMHEKCSFVSENAIVSHAAPEVDRDALLFLGDETAHSFHMDSYPAEIKKAINVIIRVQQKCDQYLELFPDNELLSHVKKVLDQIFQFHISTPLGKLTSSMQYLLKQINEWENFAAKHVSFSVEAKEIVELILQWRKIEIEGWEQLLRLKEIQHVQKASLLWYDLSRFFSLHLINSESPRFVSYDWRSLNNAAPAWLNCNNMLTLITTETDVQQFFDWLDSFIRRSVVGDFAAKLHLIRLLALHLQFHFLVGNNHKCSGNPMMENLVNVVSGVWQYYQYFLPLVRSHQQQLREPIQTRVKNEIVLEHWDTKSSLAFIEHSERINRKLKKAINDYDESVLQIPISTILHSNIMGGIVNSSGEVEAADAIPSNKSLFPLETLDYPCEDVCDNTHSQFGLEVAESAESFVSMIFERIECLRLEGVTKTMKLLAVSDLRTALKDCGLSSLMASVPENLKHNVSVFSSPAPLGLEFLTDLGSCGPPRDLLESGEKYFFRNVVELNQLRIQSVSSVSADVVMFAKDFMGYVENLFCASLRLRCGVTAATFDFKRLLIAYSSLQSSATLKNPTVAAKILFDNIIQFSDLVRYSVGMLATDGLYPGISENSANLAISVLKESCGLLFILTQTESFFGDSMQFGAKRHYSQAFVNNYDKLDVDEYLAVAIKSHSLFSSIFDDLVCLVSLDVATQMNDQYVDFIQHVKSTSAQISVDDQSCRMNRESNFPQFTAACIECASCFFCDIPNSPNVNYTGCFGESYVGSVDSRGLICSISLALKSLECCNVEEFIACLNNLQGCKLEISTASIIEKVLRKFSSVVDALVSAYKSVAKLLYVILRILRSLMAKGICSSNVDEIESTGNEGNFQEGTGMGDGNGGRDVSDEIENEEQLLGLKNSDENNSNDQSKSLDKQELENGVEMDDDFDGDYVDVPEDQENNAKEEDSDAESADEVDRELGEANIEDAVDERDWRDDDVVDEDCLDAGSVNDNEKGPGEEEEFVTNDGNEWGEDGSEGDERSEDGSRGNTEDENINNLDNETNTLPSECDEAGIETDVCDEEEIQPNTDNDDVEEIDENQSDYSESERPMDRGHNAHRKQINGFGVSKDGANTDTVLNDVAPNDGDVPNELESSLNNETGNGNGNYGSSQVDSGISQSNSNAASSRRNLDEQANPFKFPGSMNDYFRSKLDVIEGHGDSRDNNLLEDAGGQFEHAVDGLQQVLDSAEDAGQQLEKLNEIQDEGSVDEKRLANKRNSEIDHSEADNPKKKSKVDFNNFMEDVDYHIESEKDSEGVKQSIPAESISEERLVALFRDEKKSIFGSSSASLTDETVLEVSAADKNSDANDINQVATVDVLAVRLCEQLRLILEPTLKTRLQGDYRSGKRLNMRKIIPYIASGYRKDKIWLRRTKPAKRNYQVMIMTDNSKSMGPAGSVAISTMITLASALNKLEVGEICLVKFDENAQILHDFGEVFGEVSSARVRSQFDFLSGQTKLGSCLQSVLPIFERGQSRLSLDDSIVLQICFVISDARIDSDNRHKLDEVVKKMAEKNVLVVLVIIDKNLDPKDSIFNTKSVSFEGNRVVTTSYFDDFPFPYYLAIHNVNVLPELLSSALRQWFELINLQLKA